MNFRFGEAGDMAAGFRKKKKKKKKKRKKIRPSERREGQALREQARKLKQPTAKTSKNEPTSGCLVATLVHLRLSLF